MPGETRRKSKGITAFVSYAKRQWVEMIAEEGKRTTVWTVARANYTLTLVADI